MESFDFLSTELLDKMHKIQNTFCPNEITNPGTETVTINRKSKCHSFSVDTTMVPLIIDLWNEGFTTYSCRPGHENDIPYVQMAMPVSYTKYKKAIDIVRRFWSDKYIEVAMDPLNFSVSFYAFTSFDDCNCFENAFEPLNQ